MVPSEPTWQDHVAVLFSAPYWIPERKGERKRVAAEWLACMKPYFITLDDVSSVKPWSVTIYNHLASRAMPLTTDAQQFWPEDALETFRLWVNQGWREDAKSPFDRDERIPPPGQPFPVTFIRPDIRSLSTKQLDIYRSRLDDVLQAPDPAPDSKWQQIGYVHTNWCLHYQEAFAFWHRAFLLWFEKLIDHPVPYWNWMAEDASKDGSPDAGLPEAFKDEKYVHPETGETRPNPLRYAAAKDGRSKACDIPPFDGQCTGESCRFVQRNPLFYTEGDDHRQEREKLIRMVLIFQQQVVDALEFDTFSLPQGVPGYPWANIPAFDPPQPDHLYPQRCCNFDGAYEQPHDNYHGWIGPDMADNSYTAFDPIFWSYHANIDRILEKWIRSRPAAQYTTDVVIQPFVGAYASDIDLSRPERWRYTTIGQMAQDSRRIGYDYGPPVSPDYRRQTTRRPDGRTAADICGGPSAESARSRKTVGTSAPSATANARASGEIQNDPGLYVVFDGVRCTYDSYWIDVFLNQFDPTLEDADPDNPHYVGRFSRIGMGIEDDKGRCIRHGVTRILNASRCADALGLRPDDSTGISLLVTQIHTGEILGPDKYRRLPGFEGRLSWGEPWPQSNPENVFGHQDEGGCCSAPGGLN